MEEVIENDEGADERGAQESRILTFSLGNEEFRVDLAKSRLVNAIPAGVAAGNVEDIPEVVDFVVLGEEYHFTIEPSGWIHAEVLWEREHWRRLLELGTYFRTLKRLFDARTESRGDIGQVTLDDREELLFFGFHMHCFAPTIGTVVTIAESLIREVSRPLERAEKMFSEELARLGRSS